jgi:hypothetical protein
MVSFETAIDSASDTQLLKVFELIPEGVTVSSRILLLSSTV